MGVRTAPKSRRSRDGAIQETTPRQRGGTLIGLAFGLIIGVLISFGVVWYLNKTPLPFVDKLLGSEPRPATAEGAKPAPRALPGKPGDKPIEKPTASKFDFYDILEGKKTADPPADLPTATPASVAAPPPATVPAEHPSRLFLQAGAFQSLADAEKLKGRLAMLGIEAAILPVEVPEKGTLHRVRVGPYLSPEAMNQARDLLSQSGVAASVVRAKE